MFESSKKLLSRFEQNGDPNFKYVPTMWIALIQIVVFTVYIVVCYLPIDAHTHADYRSQGFSLRANVAVAVFVVLIVVNRVLHAYHRRARVTGYLQFYRQTREIIKAPVMVWGVDIAVLLVVAESWPDRGQKLLGPFTQLNVLQLIMLLSIVAILPFVVYYMHLVRVFNKVRPYPDATVMLNSAPRALPSMLDADARQSAARSSTDSLLGGAAINFSYDDESQLDVAEKQAEMIRFLQTKNRTLSRQILELTERVKNFEQTETRDWLMEDSQRVVDGKNAEIRSLREQLDNERQHVARLRQVDTELALARAELARLVESCRKYGYLEKIRLLEEMSDHQ